MPLSRGSIWRRWDVHLHSPGTALSDRYPSGSLEDFITKVNGADPPAEALGITDYLSLRCYREVRERWKAGRLPAVSLLFPNIEFRLAPPTKSHKGVNLHLLVDPSHPEHIEQMESALSRLAFEYDGQPYSCDEAGIRKFGFASDPAIQDADAAYRSGVNLFKIDFSAFRAWHKAEGWVRQNTIVAVSNKEQDGVSGLSTEHGFSAVNEEMLRFAHVVLSGNPSDRRFWLGQSADSPAELARRFGGCKPCLHGSDAHRLEDVLAPSMDRNCWIRADATFDGLKQVLFEPDTRVLVGVEPPRRPRDISIRSIEVGAPWFATTKIELNDGLVSIIGPRGSGADL